MAAMPNLVPIDGLELAALSLVGGRLVHSRISGKIELIQRLVARAGDARKNEPSLFSALLGVAKLKLRIRYPPQLLVHCRRFRTVSIASEVNEALAGVNLVLEHLAQVT